MKVTIEFTKGSLCGQPPVVLEGRNVLVVGRSANCHIRPTEQQVSRNHCILDIDCHGVTVRDFGSLNGTFVNGETIGQRQKGMSAEQGQKMKFADVLLHSGDHITLSRRFEMCIRIQPSELEQGRTRIAGKAPEQAPDPLTGYHQIRLLGTGGMAEVYLVQQEKTGHMMALKRMLSEEQPDEYSRQMFLREAFVAQQLHHPNVVRTEASGYDQQGLYILMEYCAGGSVAKKMEREGILPWRTAVHITLQVLEGLNYVHTAPVTVKLADGSTKQACGVVHRDLKTQNVFLSDNSETPQVKVADFGLAKAFETAGLTGSTLNLGGTLVFMPRQQVMDYRYCKPEVDVWAAAAMLYDMLTGKPPKPFSSNEQPIKTVLTRSAVPILQRNPKVPKRLAAVIDYALTDDPAIPFQSAAAFQKKLRECL